MTIGIELESQNRNLKLIQPLDKATPMWVKGDKCRIIQVIPNLLGNTLKFAKSGSVLVNAKNDRKSNEVDVSLKDTSSRSKSRNTATTIFKICIEIISRMRFGFIYLQRHCRQDAG